MSESELQEKWDIHKIITEAIEKAHTEPSPITLKKLETIEKKMEDNYSKRELDESFKDINLSFEEIKKIGNDISVKVGIQNGRVAKIEATVKGVIMASTVASVLFGTILGLVVYSFKLSQDNLRQSIELEFKDILK